MVGRCSRCFGDFLCSLTLFYKAFFIKVVMEFLMKTFSAQYSLKYVCFFEIPGFHRATENAPRITEDMYHPSLSVLGKTVLSFVVAWRQQARQYKLQKRVYSVLRPRIGEHVRSRAFMYEAIKYLPEEICTGSGQFSFVHFPHFPRYLILFDIFQNITLYEMSVQLFGKNGCPSLQHAYKQ